MKIVVVGGTGRLGSQVVAELQRRGHEAVAAAPSTGFDTISGAGVAEGLAGAQVVVDVSNAPSFEEAAVLEFFQTSTGTLLAAEREAGTKHHVVLSIVGADRAPDSGYMRAKVAQERLVADGGVPYTIIRATQFFEFLGGIADSAVTDGTVRLPSARPPTHRRQRPRRRRGRRRRRTVDRWRRRGGRPRGHRTGRAGPPGPVRDRRPATGRHRRLRAVLRCPPGRSDPDPGTGRPHRPDASRRLAQPRLIIDHAATSEAPCSRPRSTMSPMNRGKAKLAWWSSGV